MERAELVKMMKEDCEEKIANNLKDLNRIAVEIEKCAKRMQKEIDSDFEKLNNDEMFNLDVRGGEWDMQSVECKVKEYERVLNELKKNKELFKAMDTLEKAEESK